MEFKSEPVCVDEDIISKLPDDIIVYILEKVDISEAIRTGILSTRWRHIPLLLSNICLDTDDFMTHSSTTMSDYEMIDAAMAHLIQLLARFVTSSERERCITTLSLEVYLIDDRLCDIRKLIADATDRGKLKNLELDITTVKDSLDSDESDMQKHAKSLMCFFDSSPAGVFCCLTKLCLNNACFTEIDMNRLLTSCEQLQDLTLNECETEISKPLKIDVAHSKLCALTLYYCFFKRVELVCLPKLRQLCCEFWACGACPASFHYVPALEEVKLICDATKYHKQFKITELLSGTTNTQVLTLDFQGEKIWIEREGKELQTSFKAIRKLFLHGIYVGFDLTWTLVLLQAARSVQVFGVKIWDHPCDELLNRKKLYPERTMGLFDATELGDSTTYLHLKELEFGGFRHVKEHLDFIRAVMDRAPNLKTVLLKDKDECKDCEKCEAIEVSMFPKNKDEEDIVVHELRDGDPGRPVQIIFCPTKLM